MKKFFNLYICLLVLVVFSGCHREPEPPRTDVVIISEIIEPYYNSAKLTCELSSNFTIEYVRACLSLTPDFSQIHSTTLLTEIPEGVYTGEITGLEEYTTYYVRYQISNIWSKHLAEQTSDFQTFSRDMPIVLTKNVFDISYTNAKIMGEIKTDGGSPILEYGVCYSRSTTPTVQDNKLAYGSGLGNFMAYLESLEEGTTYFVRTYAVNANGTYYGKCLQFTTYARTFHEGIEYVDLGLSVKWATCNVGAESPSQTGDYFAFGEVEPKTNYTWDTYKWCTSENNTLIALTKYYQSISGCPINLSVEDDAARANWGGEWRMPTSSEIHELLEYCTWELTGNGYKVRSTKNGNYIFLPAGGCMNGKSPFKRGEQGYYWSSAIINDSPKFTLTIYFNLTTHCDSQLSREKGALVRPVYPK